MSNMCANAYVTFYNYIQLPINTSVDASSYYSSKVYISNNPCTNQFPMSLKASNSALVKIL